MVGQLGTNKTSENKDISMDQAKDCDSNVKIISFTTLNEMLSLI